MEKLKEILRNNRMSSRPEYFSGRGATLSDLDSKILEGIYQAILKEYGELAGKGFISMVDGIEVMSATTFIQELYKLYYSGWEYKSEKDESGIAIGKDEDGNYDLVNGMIGMCDHMFKHNDQTPQIKGRFLRLHGIKPKMLYDEYGFIYEYYE